MIKNTLYLYKTAQGHQAVCLLFISMTEELSGVEQKLTYCLMLASNDRAFGSA